MRKPERNMKQEKAISSIIDEKADVFSSKHSNQDDKDDNYAVAMNPSIDVCGIFNPILLLLPLAG